MSAQRANPDKIPVDPEIDRYISEFQHRHRQFLNDRRATLRESGMDAFGRLYHEHFLFPSKEAYDVLLQSILAPEERDRLQIDLKFTEAWQIFVDLCWVRKKATRSGILFGSLALVLAVVGFSLWALPQMGVYVLAIVGLFLLIGAAPVFLGRRPRRR
ncbi:MAG: hypothetical protein WCG79_02340 [Verrucomicrobiota bacterium]|jgi:hypothetical protein